MISEKYWVSFGWFAKFFLAVRGGTFVGDFSRSRDDGRVRIFANGFLDVLSDWWVAAGGLD